ncbi:hypothetical protein G0Q06_03085 [Puniceicoccales bacterium CK1056]|uniref:Uncharacterized protein n=1 Tax=Oceanipulchritudo coccoides TaxID=2706888 RepID=A0A6B2M072_9BACT|nr:hypothetical protein [Oceanipulchritudo coccoides]NDV61427.1 hypothetical protein [Oceanipulchritudo coccoides]
MNSADHIVPSTKWSQIAFWTTVAVLVLSSVILVLNPSLLEILAWEDGPVEYSGFIFLALTGFILARAGYRATRLPGYHRLKGMVLLFAGLGFLLAAGEEISWGQRLIGFETPEPLAKVNEQQEFNLHNMEKGLVDHSVRYGIALFAVAGLIFHATQSRRFLGFRTPDLYLVHAFLLLGVYQNFQAIDKPFYISAIALLFSLLYLYTKGHRRSAAIPAVAILLGCLLTFLNWSFQASLGINTPPEIREALFPMICSAYALWLASDPEDQLPQES